jgi:hypothetical protein
MQEGCHDWSNSGLNCGCCLNCSKNYVGCLCYDCKCSKCLWYCKISGLKGICELTEWQKEEREREKQEWKEQKIIEEEIEYNKSQELKKENIIKDKEIRDKGIIPNIYTCQNCRREFVCEEDFIIIPNKQPLCKFCKNRNI